MLKLKSNVIKCPHCGASYTNSEIFYPEDLLGTQVDIVKDDKGEIITYNGEPPTLTQSYTCDKCNKKFKVNAKLTFVITPESEYDFEDIFSFNIDDEEL